MIYGFTRQVLGKGVKYTFYKIANLVFSRLQEANLWQLEEKSGFAH